MAGTGRRRTSRHKIAEQEARIRELEEKIARLEVERGKVPEGTAASILQGLGEMFPGLDRLLQGLGKSEAFRERLKAIDEEIEARLKGEPLKRVKTGSGPSSIASRPVGRSTSRTPTLGRQRTPVAEREVSGPQEPPVDVFDEGTYLRVVAELPGIEEEDVKVDLRGTQLLLSAVAAARRYRKEVTLPCPPKGQMGRLYRNGILELTLRKE